ncbi:uncharacterized protein (TIGR02118 family) [Sphingobium sp. OAS761]|uniref:EthD family reductase n=1 Tax=Sphingobium sp. OAS761 TaxID=2817901 RepID=UPI00209E3059|nr:EthD family reductase [Sphingobium sp. OAS761]MCP1470270.1 uncharacterized protein (TIGR02118 family) [Sphingobium sp. OAS761]
MTKSVCALVHKPGSTRAAFQRYYEDNHAPLAVGLFPFSGYARNHLVDAVDFGWDTISEFWAEDIVAAAALMDGPIGDRMRADEERFMDRSRIRAAGAEEIILSTGQRVDSQQRRTALLIDGERERENVRLQARRFAQQLAEQSSGVSIDMVQAWEGAAFPATAIIWVPGWPAGTDTYPSFVTQALKLVRHATPFAQLSG